ncbi:MAG: uroporphyrinogen decarboxylase family protein [Armatimonadota bacterium]
MNHRERIACLFAGQSADRPGFWLGNPSAVTRDALCARLGVADEEGIRRAVHDDCRWFPGDHMAPYRHPEGRSVFDFMYATQVKTCHGQPGCFADCENPAEVDHYPWPNADYFDLSVYRAAGAGTEDCWRYGGAWCPFFHIVADYFGMENYFMKMYTDPDVVHAVTRHVVDFYLQLNHRLFTETGDLIDAFFFGNDFGTQENLLVSPENFTEFVLPYFKELIAQAKSFGKPVQLHSCGAVAKVIPLLIDAGIDALHPLQALAKGMDAETLAREYRNDLIFVGGVDTQELMWRGTPQQIRDEVERLQEIFGGRWIISPSHEVLLPEVPVENVIALCEAATGLTPEGSLMA